MKTIKFLIAAALVGMVCVGCSNNTQHNKPFIANDAADFSDENSSGEKAIPAKPVYHLKGRWDIIVDRPAATAYVFERGDQIEYVYAHDVLEMSGGNNATNTGYYIKRDDGKFMPLFAAK